LIEVEPPRQPLGVFVLNAMAFKHYKYFIDRAHLMQFACFECRKSFKRKLGREHYACPQCGKEMCEMGRQFKAPALDDVKQWRKVKALVRGGITFHSQCLYSLRNMPKVLRELRRLFDECECRNLLRARAYFRQHHVSAGNNSPLDGDDATIRCRVSAG
jgi:predicted RNA-binding Zn-ribbon protein involved in translation (DUF1610 family)